MQRILQWKQNFIVNHIIAIDPSTTTIDNVDQIDGLGISRWRQIPICCSGDAMNFGISELLAIAAFAVAVFLAALKPARKTLTSTHAQGVALE